MICQVRRLLDVTLQLALGRLYSAPLSPTRGGQRAQGGGASGDRAGDSMLISPAYAQTGLGGSSDMLVSLLPFILIFVIMYFLILRPQQQRSKQHQSMVKNLRRGDTVISSGGLVGKVTKVVDDDQIEVE